MSDPSPADNPDIQVTSTEVLSDGWGRLTRASFEQTRRDGTRQSRVRESYDRGNGAVLLPYDPVRGTVLLTRQFRYPPFATGHPDGMLVEAAAGVIDPGEGATEAMRREAGEELGVELDTLEHLFRAYTSPGALTEHLDFFAARYGPGSRVGPGGGLAQEGEDIEVLELDFAAARGMVTSGAIVDVKTITLLQWAALDGPFASLSQRTAET